MPSQGWFVLSARAGFFLFVFCVSGACDVLFLWFRLSVPVWWISRKGSSPKWPISGTPNPTHSLTMMVTEDVIFVNENENENGEN